jgi:hypothetical protein
VVQENEVTALVPTFSGNPLEAIPTEVNENFVALVGDGMVVCRELAVVLGRQKVGRLTWQDVLV